MGDRNYYSDINCQNGTMYNNKINDNSSSIPYNTNNQDPTLDHFSKESYGYHRLNPVSNTHTSNTQDSLYTYNYDPQNYPPSNRTVGSARFSPTLELSTFNFQDNVFNPIPSSQMQVSDDIINHLNLLKIKDSNHVSNVISNDGNRQNSRINNYDDKNANCYNYQINNNLPLAENQYQVPIYTNRINNDFIQQSQISNTYVQPTKEIFQPPVNPDAKFSNQSTSTQVNLTDVRVRRTPDFYEYLAADNYLNATNTIRNIKLPSKGHIACTLNTITKYRNSVNSLKIPFGIIFTPMMKQAIPTIYPKEVTRCRSCFAYINPYTSWIDQKNFQCNFCGRKGSLNPDQLVDLKYNGTDMGQTMFETIATNSVYEIIAPSSFCKSPPKNPCYIFLLEITKSSLTTGYIECFFESLMEYVYKVCPNKRSCLALICYGHAINTFCFKTDYSKYFRMKNCVIVDLEDPCLPTHDEFFFYPSKNKKITQIFLSEIKNWIINHQPTENERACLGSVLEFSKSMVNKNGAKFFLFSFSIPSFKIGEIIMKDGSCEENEKKLVDEGKLPTPSLIYYKKLGLELFQNSITLDMFFVSMSKSSHLNELVPLFEKSCGDFYYFPYDNITHRAIFKKKLKSDLNFIFNQDTYLDALLILRTSSGLSIDSYYGNFSIVSSGKVQYSYINESSTIAYKLKYEDDLLVHKDHIYLQVTTFYCSLGGERRLRVTTIPIHVVEDLKISFPLVYKNVDGLCVVVFIAKLMEYHIKQSSIKDGRKALLNNLCDIVKAYYQTDKLNFDGSQILLDQSLEFVPVLLHSLSYYTRNDINGSKTGVNNKIAFFELLKTGKMIDILSHLYPFVYIMKCLNNFGGELDYQTLLPSIQNINKGCSCLMDFGSNPILFISSTIQDKILKQYFKVDNIDELPSLMIDLPESEEFYIIKKHLENVTNYGNRKPCNPLLIIKHENNGRNLFYKNLILDRKPDGSNSFNEFLSKIKSELL